MTGSFCIHDGLKYANYVNITGIVSRTLRTADAVRFLINTKAHEDYPDGSVDFRDTVLSVVYYGETSIRDGDNIGIIGWLRQVRYMDQQGNPLLATEIVAEKFTFAE